MINRSPPQDLHNIAKGLRRDFPVLTTKQNGKAVIYLDNSATTQKPVVVVHALNAFYKKNNANIHRGIYTLAEKATELYEQARRDVAAFIHASSEEIIFTSGTTNSLNTIARAVEPSLSSEDEIVITIMEHHSNFLPWQQLAQRTGAALKIIPITQEYLLDTAAMNKIITKKTKIVAFVYVSNVLGTINPVREIINAAKNVHALTIIDAAQAVPHLPINVGELDCDFLAFSGHKIMGPTGIGVLYGKKQHLQQLEPVSFGGEMAKEVTLNAATWNDLPWKWEAGTPPIAEAIALAQAIAYYQSLPLQELSSHLQNLRTYTIQELQKIKRVKLFHPVKHEAAPIISFTLSGIHPHDLAEIAQRENICIRAGHHCAMPLHTYLQQPATARISLYYYNTTEDIDAFIKSIRRAIALFN